MNVILSYLFDDSRAEVVAPLASDLALLFLLFVFVDMFVYAHLLSHYALQINLLRVIVVLQ